MDGFRHVGAGRYCRTSLLAPAAAPAVRETVYVLLLCLRREAQDPV